MVSIIVAMGKGRLIGRKNDLLWRIPDDLKRFKSLTVGHPIVMGRKTFDSIGKALPGRTSIVITRSSTLLAVKDPNVILVHSIDEAIEKASLVQGGKEVFIIGGGQIYEQVLPSADRLYLTLIDDTKEGDVFFPPYEYLFTKKISEEPREWNGLKYRWVTLER